MGYLFRYLDPLVCTTRDGVKNVFRDVQVGNIDLIGKFTPGLLFGGKFAAAFFASKTSREIVIDQPC